MNKKFPIMRWATRCNMYIMFIIIFIIYTKNWIYFKHNDNLHKLSNYDNIQQRYLISYVMYAPYSSKVNRNVHKVCRYNYYYYIINITMLL